MVLGDTRQHGRRAECIAAPARMLVDDMTRRATEAAIAYEDAGTHQSRAASSRRAGGRCGSSRSVGGGGRDAALEAPFVGRDARAAS